MKHRRTNRFKRGFTRLPDPVKAQARKAFKLFDQDPSHPSLAIERVKGYAGVWAGRINEQVRWTFHYEEDPDTGETICVHRVIGAHDTVYRSP